MRLTFQVFAFFPLLALLFCKPKEGNTGVSYAGPPTIVYKTKGDYFKNVPVTLSSDKTEIIAYPSVKDVYYNGALAYPTLLSKDYLLDNRGVNANSGFLKLTYEEYSKLKEVPKLEELYAMLIDKDPFTEMYNLGDRNRFKNEQKEISAIVDKGGLKKFKKLK